MGSRFGRRDAAFSLAEPPLGFDPAAGLHRGDDAEVRRRGAGAAETLEQHRLGSPAELPDPVRMLAKLCPEGRRRGFLEGEAVQRRRNRRRALVGVR